MQIILTESQIRSLMETNRIRQWGDSDFKKANRTQINLTPEDFAAMADEDDAFKQSHQMSGHTRDMYKNIIGPKQQAKVDEFKKQVTKNVRNRHLAATGRENITGDDGILASDKILQELNDAGIELSMNGKLFSYGNGKLPQDILIVNLTSAWDCPSIKNGECKLGDICYARKGESGWKGRNQQVRNIRNEVGFQYMTAKEILHLLELYIEAAPVRIHSIRISEDGDFKDQATVDFCDKLAGHLQAKYGINTCAYTHRRLDYGNVRNMIINMSDTGITGGDRYYLVTGKKDWMKIPEGYTFDGNDYIFKCHCDCARCRFCYNTREENGETGDTPTKVYVAFHR